MTIQELSQIAMTFSREDRVELVDTLVLSLADPPLNAGERAKILTALIHDLNGSPIASEDQSSIDAEWSQTINRRIQEVESGKVAIDDGDEIHRQLRSGTRR